jgi:hypothetical protein
MTIHIIDDDTSAVAPHWLHTNGEPCPHGFTAIGKGFDCPISPTAPTGMQTGVFDHDVQNGFEQFYIFVVQD